MHTVKSTSDDNRARCFDLIPILNYSMESLIKFVQDEFVTKKEFPKFSAGDTITVYYEIKEGEKTRTQFLKVLLFKEEVLEQQKHLLSVKCPVPLEWNVYSQLTYQHCKR